MSRFRRSLWLYPLFQIPLIFVGVCLTAAALCWLLGLGKPHVAVAIALNLSNSTYQGQSFNAPNTVMAQELAAVRSYIDLNFQQLKTPNEIQIFGFGDRVIPLTSSLSSDRQKLEAELIQALAKPNLPSEIGTGTNLDQAIEQTTTALNNAHPGCRELLLVTNQVSIVSPGTIVQAINRKVKINTVLLGGDDSVLRSSAIGSGGIYLSIDPAYLPIFFTEKIFVHFNSNLKWILLWLSGAWIAFMWFLTLPLDRFIFQGLMKYPMHVSGQLALGNALFWTVATPLILSGLWRLLDLPFFLSC